MNLYNNEWENAMANANCKTGQTKYLIHPPLDQDAAAAFLGLRPQTLANWRHHSKGPAYLKLSPGPRGRVGYLLEDLQDFREKCRVNPEKAA